jgi:hypothetical protein
MAINNDKLAQLDSDTPDKEPHETDGDIWDLQHWQLGSREGKRSNLHVMSAELGRKQEEYRGLDERVRNFVACHMLPEAMQYEDDIHVSSSLNLTRAN